MMNTLNKANSYKRWYLFSYSLLSFIITLGYIFFNHTFFKVDWYKYDYDGIYRGKVDKVLEHGTFWINGNINHLNSILLNFMFILGAILSLIIFIIAWKNYNTRTWTPLLSFAGFLLPIIIHYDTNILKLIIVDMRLCY